MANYKKRKRRRGGAKGCSWCTPWKATGCRRVEKQQRMLDRRANVSFKEQLREVRS